MRLIILSFMIGIFLSGCATVHTITKMPKQEEFQDLKETVSLLDTNMPESIRKTIDNFTIENLNQGKAISYSDTIIEHSGNKNEGKPMAIQYSVITMDATLKEFLKVIPIENWGSHLSGWKGGETRQIPNKVESNSRYQAERMVLALGNDMTKAEIIETTDTSASVFWRVYYSDNGSTLSDLGKLEVTTLGEKKIKVVFHSAHDLKFYGLIRLPNFMVRSGLERTFLEHLRKYKKLDMADKEPAY